MMNRLKNIFLGRKDRHRPNVIFILLDQFRSDALASHPIFEKLKGRGIFFPQTITYAPYTLASCHATFTGMYGRQNGVDAYTKSHHYDQKNCFTIAQYLQSSGYYTRGYSFSDILIPHNGFDHVKFVHEDDEPGILDSHKNEIDECLKQDKPFFCYLHYGEIHHQVVKEVIKKYTIHDERYFGRIEENKLRYNAYAWSAGEYLSSILDYLNSRDPEGNNLVVVMTDHGGSNGEKSGEKAYGTFTYDYTIKIWHYLIWPQGLPKNVVIGQQVRTIDILPTILDLTKIPQNKKKKPIMGESLVSLIERNDEADRLAFSETGGVDGAYPSPHSPNICCVRDGEWKLIQNKTTNQFELYHLKSDWQENTNLYGKETEQADRLWEAMIPYL